MRVAILQVLLLHTTLIVWCQAVVLHNYEAYRCGKRIFLLSQNSGESTARYLSTLTEMHDGMQHPNVYCEPVSTSDFVQYASKHKDFGDSIYDWAEYFANFDGIEKLYIREHTEPQVLNAYKDSDLMIAGCLLLDKESNVLEYKKVDYVTSYLENKGHMYAALWNATTLCGTYSTNVRNNKNEFSPFHGLPLVLVPDIGASPLEAKFDDTNLDEYDLSAEMLSDFLSSDNQWKRVRANSSHSSKSFDTDMRLRFNDATGKTRNRKGVFVRVPSFKSPHSFEVPNEVYFKNFTNHAINSWMYTPEESIFGAPYDYRFAPNEADDYFKKLKLLLESSYEYNFERGAVIIAHGLGGLYIKYFLQNQQREWKFKYVAKFVCVGVPWGGSVLTMFDFLKARKSSPARHTFPSTMLLLPNRYVWEPSEVLIRTPTKSYTVENVAEFLTEIGYTDAAKIYQNISSLIKVDSAPEVEVHCLYALDLATPQEYFLNDTLLATHLAAKQLDGVGDGHVVLRSAAACLQWHEKMPPGMFFHKSLPYRGHNDMLAAHTFFSYISKIIFRAPQN